MFEKFPLPKNIQQLHSVIVRECWLIEFDSFEEIQVINSLLIHNTFLKDPDSLQVEFFDTWVSLMCYMYEMCIIYKINAKKESFKICILSAMTILL